jgi:hypothetical protein
MIARTLGRIGARHGPDAARVVETLVAWAEQKEAALRSAGIRDRPLTDFELPRAIDPTMFVGLRFYDREVKA